MHEETLQGLHNYKNKRQKTVINTLEQDHWPKYPRLSSTTVAMASSSSSLPALSTSSEQHHCHQHHALIIIFCSDISWRMTGKHVYINSEWHMGNYKTVRSVHVLMRLSGVISKLNVPIQYSFLTVYHCCCRFSLLIHCDVGYRHTAMLPN